MNNASEQVLQAIDTIVDNAIGQLEFDKTIQGLIYSIVNLDTGEYKVRYNGSIFSAYSMDLTITYKVDQMVFVSVPEGNFSNKKLIRGLVTDQSLSTNQQTALQNSIFDASPDFNSLYGNTLYDNKAYGVIAGAPYPDNPHSYNYMCNFAAYENNEYTRVFQLYANTYDLIRISGKFLTQFYEQHNKGNYGLEIEFFAQGDNIVSYRLDLNSFNGDPYGFSVYSPQSVIVKVQRNYLIGIKSIKLFEENFVYDRIVENGKVTEKENTTNPNIFVKDLSIQFVEQKDLSDGNYYLIIRTPQGTVFSPSVSILTLEGQIVYQGNNIMDENNCVCKWFERDLSVEIGSEEFDKDAGFGWRKLNTSSNIIQLESRDVVHSQTYKLVTIYNESVVSSATTEVINDNNKYLYHIEQITSGDNISLRIVNDLDDKVLLADWYLSYPDGSYFALDKKVNSLQVNEYLKYSSVTFYCAIYDGDLYLGTLDYVIMNSESDEDVIITYIGEDNYRYDANGDIAIEDSEKERTLEVVITWKEGYGTDYSVDWLFKDRVLTEEPYSPETSMMNSIWVDKNNILHYNIRQKYKVNSNDNVLTVRINTITGEQYYFNKEILFLKDGDQGTNGTTYVIAIRPCDDSGQKLSGFRPLYYNNDWGNALKLKCYVYQDGTLINDDTGYDIYYKWSAINLSLSATDRDTTSVNGLTAPTFDSISKDLQFYVKIEVRISDRLNGGRIVGVYATYPVDVAVGGINAGMVDITSIPSYIKYTSSGLTPSFYNNNIQFLYGENEYTDKIYSANEDLIKIIDQDGLRFLRPAASFIFENIGLRNFAQDSNIGVLKCSINDANDSFVIHPIVMYLDTYGNEAINGWDGTALEINNDEGYIFAPQIGAGVKNTDNTFTGVVMGKDSQQSKIGLYGYQAGKSSFGLMEDGTAYFGIAGPGGRIEIDGTRAIIRGGGKGDLLGGDAPNGMTLTFADIQEAGNTKAIKIGAGVFFVDYNGYLEAMNATVKGTIYAKEGRIGCNDNKEKGWIITTDQIHSGRDTIYVAFDSNNDLVEGTQQLVNPFAIWVGQENPGTYDPTQEKRIGRLKNTAPFAVTKDGYVSMTNAYIKGAIDANEGSIAGWVIIDTRLTSENGQIELSTDKSDKYRIRFGTLSEDRQSFKEPARNYFGVTKDGMVEATGAILKGDIYAKTGYFGCTYNADTGLYDTDGWKITTNRFSSGTDETYVALDSNPRGDFAIWAGAENPGRYVKGSANRMGKVTGDNIAPFSVTRDGFVYMSNAYINGAITANEGTIGGWTIEDNRLYNDTQKDANGKVYVGLDSNTTTNCPFAFWTGKKEGGLSYDPAYVNRDGKIRSPAPFVVTKDGYVHAQSGHIGGWEISDTEFINNANSNGNTVGLRSDSDSPYAIWAGAKVPGGKYDRTQDLMSDWIENPAKFVVTKDGFVYMENSFVKGGILATQGSIAGWKITDTSITSENGAVGLSSSGSYSFWAGPVDQEGKTYFGVTSSGLLSCSNAVVQGSIDASYLSAGNGYIGGWEITSESLKSVGGFAELKADGTIRFKEITMSWDGTKNYGRFGLVEGEDEQQKTTYNLGIEILDPDSSFVVESLKNIRFTAKTTSSDQTGNVYIEGDKIIIGDEATEQSNKTEIVFHALPENQRGIYARFAPDDAND